MYGEFIRVFESVQRIYRIISGLRSAFVKSSSCHSIHHGAPEMVRYRVAGLVLALALGAGTFAQTGDVAQIPPDVVMVNDLSCAINQHGKKWQAVCTAHYLAHENYHHDPFVVIFRERNSEKEANDKDVDRWMKKVRKIQAENQFVYARKFEKEKRK